MLGITSAVIVYFSVKMEPLFGSMQRKLDRLSTIRDADNIVVINNGEIVEQGSHQQLLDRQGFFYHLYLSQFKGLAI